MSGASYSKIGLINNLYIVILTHGGHESEQKDITEKSDFALCRVLVL